MLASRYQSRYSMYIRGLIEAVPMVGQVRTGLKLHFHLKGLFLCVTSMYRMQF